MKECTLQISTGYRDSTLYPLDRMLTLTDRSRHTAKQIFLNEKGEEAGALLALPPSPALLHLAQPWLTGVRS